MIDYINDCPFPHDEEIQEEINYNKHDNVVKSVKKKMVFPPRLTDASRKKQTPRPRESAPGLSEKITDGMKSFEDQLDRINEALEEEIELAKEKNEKRILALWMEHARKGYCTEDEARGRAQEGINKLRSM